MQLDPLLRDILSEVQDPELGVNIVDLGLVYNAVIKDGVAHIRMTLTTPACPYADIIVERVQNIMEEYELEVAINFVFDPPWNKTMIAEHILIEKGLV